MQSQHSSVLTVILKLVIGGLTSIILIVLGTVNLQLQIGGGTGFLAGECLCSGILI